MLIKGFDIRIGGQKKADDCDIARRRFPQDFRFLASRRAFGLGGSRFIPGQWFSGGDGFKFGGLL